MENGYNGIIYKKEPFDVLSEAKKLGVFGDSNYILLHLKNKHQWKSLLEGRKIDPKHVYGIDIFALEDYGIILPNPVFNFTDQQILYVLSKRFLHPEESLMDILTIITGEKPSTPVFLKFNRQVDRILEELSKKMNHKGE